jgi:hypothetical protein
MWDIKHTFKLEWIISILQSILVTIYFLYVGLKYKYHVEFNYHWLPNRRKWNWLVSIYQKTRFLKNRMEHQFCSHNSAGLRVSGLAKRFTSMLNGVTTSSHYARGCYFTLPNTKAAPFRHLIYPTPEDCGLGVHVTTLIDLLKGASVWFHYYCGMLYTVFVRSWESKTIQRLSGIIILFSWNSFKNNVNVVSFQGKNKNKTKIKSHYIFFFHYQTTKQVTFHFFSCSVTLL